MDKLIEELTYFAYDGEMSFFDITKGEAKAFLNKLGEKDDEIERLTISLQAQEELTMNEHIKVERLNNIINELEKYLIEQVEKSYSNDYDNVLDKLDELKGSDKE